MKKFVNVLFVFAVVFALSLMTSVAFAQEDEVNPSDIILGQQYTDVNDDHWAYNTLSILTDRDIIHGYIDGSFCPDKEVTRQEFAKVLVNFTNLPTTNIQTTTFSDVSTDRELYTYIEAISPYLTKYKNTKTGEILFFPDNTVSRGDIITSTLKMLDVNVDNIDLTVFNHMVSDSSETPEYMKPYLAYAIENNIIGGYGDGMIKGMQTLTRAEMCVILYNIFENVEMPERYVASNAVSDYFPPEPVVEVYVPSYTYEDLDILARIMHSEAGSYWISDEVQMMFGNVVLNRVASSQFPNTIAGVAFQPGQYSSAKRLYSFTNIAQRTYDNARKLLEGYRVLPDYVIFQANFKQGRGVYQAVYIDKLGWTYFCY